MAFQEVSNLDRVPRNRRGIYEILPMLLRHPAPLLPSLDGGDRLADCLCRACKTPKLGDHELGWCDGVFAVHALLYVFHVRGVNVENVNLSCRIDRMDNSAESITKTVKSLRERAGLTMGAMAKALGYKTPSGYQRYEDASAYGGGFLKRDIVAGLARALVGKGDPAVTEREVWALAGPEFTPGRPFSTFDPDREEPLQDEGMTHGSETGLRGVPDGASPQLDVTAGMGAGGITIISEGVRGKSGMTFAAEDISDYWRVPPVILASMGNVKPTDITFVPCQGDSMAPTLLEGDVVVVDTRHRWPSPDGLYALTDPFGGIIVKRLHVTDEGSDGERVVMVVSDNAKHETRRATVDDLHIVGRVLRKFGLVG